LRIHVNGESHEVADELSLQDLVDHLNLAPKRLAIELNQNVVRRGDWPAMILKEDDRVEIVHFVGGGLMNAKRATTRFIGASIKSCRLSAGNGERVNMLKKFLGLLAYITILAVLAVTAKADATSSGKLSGAQMVPPNTSKAVGVGTVILISLVCAAKPAL